MVTPYPDLVRSVQATRRRAHTHTHGKESDTRTHDQHPGTNLRRTISMDGYLRTPIPNNSAAHFNICENAPYVWRMCTTQNTYQKRPPSSGTTIIRRRCNKSPPRALFTFPPTELFSPPRQQNFPVTVQSIVVAHIQPYTEHIHHHCCINYYYTAVRSRCCALLCVPETQSALGWAAHFEG